MSGPPRRSLFDSAVALVVLCSALLTANLLLAGDLVLNVAPRFRLSSMLPAETAHRSPVDTSLSTLNAASPSVSAPVSAPAATAAVGETRPAQPKAEPTRQPQQSPKPAATKPSKPAKPASFAASALAELERFPVDEDELIVQRAPDAESRVPEVQHFKQPKAVLKAQEARMRADPDSMRDYLVVICAGDDSIHLRNLWHIQPRLYDLAVIYFGTNASVAQQFRESSEFYFESRAFLFQNYRNVMNADDFWAGYRYVFLPPDDLRMDASSLTLLFAIADAYGLRMAAPGISGHYAHPITARQPECFLRYTNFIETMAMLFRGDLITSVFLPSLEGLPDKDPGWGIDTVCLTWIEHHDVAVIDAVEACHTRPPGAFIRSRASMYDGVDPIEFQASTLQRFGVQAQEHREYLRYCRAGSQRVNHRPDSWFGSERYMRTPTSKVVFPKR